MVKTSTSLIPTLSSNIGDNGVVIASSNYSDYEKWLAFNKSLSDGWASATNVPQWLGYDFKGKKAVLTGYSLQYGFSKNYEIKSWTIEGSNDNFQTFDILDEQKNYSYTPDSYTKQEFSIENGKAYYQYRINVKEVYSTNVLLAYIDELELYGYTVETKLTLKNPTTNQHYSLADKTLILLPDASDETMIKYGIETGKEIQLDDAFDTIITVNADDTTKTEKVTPFSVYEYISETPTVIAYAESTDDITVSTTTEPYYLYDEFGDEVEVLYYTDAENVAELNLIVEANYSPIDELDGDVEVVTWTDESSDTAKRVLEISGIHKPIFTYPINPLEIKGELQNLVIQETSESKDARYLISNNNSTWYKWDVDKFIVVDQSQVATIGMTLADLMNIDYSKWVYDKINVGVYLTNDSLVKKIELTDITPTKSSKVSDLHFYILNTTAKIDIELRGNTIMGQVTDDDSSKVQYRVTLNGGYYYPTTGNYTALSDSPSNIKLTLRSQDIKISEWNDLKVEFKDSFGTVDSWEIQFIGQYDGLLFKTTDGEFYSSDIGEVLRYLDFGLIIAGQTTMEHEVVLKNQYGYGVKDVGLSVVESNLPSGVKVEFSNDGVENWQSRLPVATTMNSDEQVTFRVRMRTELTSEPRSNGSFDIYVNALKDE